MYDILISELKQQLNYATKDVLKIMQASFNFLWVFLPQKLPILKVQSQSENSK